MAEQTDLPLSANVNDFSVTHYILDLQCVIPTKTFEGCLTVFYKKQEDGQPNQSIIFDCCNIEISSVWKCVRYSDMTSESVGSANIFKLRNLQKAPLKFKLEQWYLKVFGVELCAGDVSGIVQIFYRTKAQGKSLKWTRDQDSRPCVFTAGAWINNRSLFPSHDSPVSLSTWEAFIECDKDLTVLMTGDYNEVIVKTNQDKKMVYYATTMPLPVSTVAIAIGHWKKHNVDETQTLPIKRFKPDFCEHQPSNSCGINYHSSPAMPCRIFACASILENERITILLGSYIKKALEELNKLLGPHPFLRLDVLVVPSCFGSMALASPNLLFLSQTIVIDCDTSMGVHLAHELSHSWFGLIIGPLDWTEEWLSEGFASYVEDYIHAQVMTKWDPGKKKHYRGLRTLFKYKTLTSEINNTQEELQLLRQAKSDSHIVKNGLNPTKAFTQVHYLKGFFYLKHLSTFVGDKAFNEFLGKYVRKFHGQLVTSKDFLEYYIDQFSSQLPNDLDLKKVSSAWLDNPGIPDNIVDLLPGEDNVLWSEVKELTHQWVALNKHFKKKRKSRKKAIPVILKNQLFPEQLLLLLENLLELDKIDTRVLKKLNKDYRLSEYNPEVQHRWYELVIKYRIKDCYKDVRSFLCLHQSMGVYLYGELSSGDEEQVGLAKDCYQLIQQDMDDNLKITVREMLHGTAF